MCIFSAAVRQVAGTRIFARRDGGDRQILVYSMSVTLAGDTAMVLPLPVPTAAAEDAVDFIDLSAVPRFFAELAKTFPSPPVSRAVSGALAPASFAPQPLVVHDVGDFEASFVPTIADFDRLDPRFRLSPEVWSSLPGVADRGFAVFKLRDRPEPPAPRSWWSRLTGRAREPDPASPGPKTIHPMAFSFPTRDPAALFFPTVHVHDGQVHERARFDHTLYCQLSTHARDVVQNEELRHASGAPPIDAAAVAGWIRGDRALLSTGIGACDGAVDAFEIAYKRELSGQLPNQDTWVRF